MSKQVETHKTFPWKIRGKKTHLTVNNIIYVILVLNTFPFYL